MAYGQYFLTRLLLALLIPLSTIVEPISLIYAEDCNQNGVEDEIELADGIEFDCNQNGKLDSCETEVEFTVNHLTSIKMEFQPISFDVEDEHADGMGRVAVIFDSRRFLQLYSLSADNEIVLENEIELSGILSALKFVHLNDDDFSDLVVAIRETENRGATIRVLWGKPDGEFELGPIEDSGIWVDDLIAHDFDQNGNPELIAIARRGRDSYKLIKDFEQSSFTVEDFNQFSFWDSWAQGDFNGDGFLDFGMIDEGRDELAVIGSTENLKFFRAATLVFRNYRLNTSMIAAGDYNGDGFDDFIFGPSGDSLDRHFAVVPGRRDSNYSISDIIKVPAPNDHVYGLACHDFNNDGLADIFAQSVSGATIHYSPSNKNVPDSWLLSRGADSGGGTLPRIRLGDLDGDGSKDLAAFAIGQANIAFFPSGSTDRISKVPAKFVGEEVLSGLRVDLDDDGDLDHIAVIIRDRDTHVDFIYEGSSPYTETINHLEKSVIVVEDWRRGRLISGYFNQDEYIDFAYLEEEGLPSLYISNELNDYSHLRQSNYRLEDDGPGVFGHFNDDEHLDLAIGGVAGVVILNGDGDKGFRGQRTYEEIHAREIIAVELNSDARIDLVISDYERNLVFILHQQSAGGFTEVQSIPVSRAPYNILCEDLNQDGFKDLAFLIGFPSMWIVAQGKEGGTFESSVQYPIEVPDGVWKLNGQVVSSQLDNNSQRDLLVIPAGTPSLYGVLNPLSDSAKLFKKGIGFVPGNSFEGPTFENENQSIHSTLFINNRGGIIETIISTEFRFDVDCNQNGIPDECELSGVTDVNGDGALDDCQSDCDEDGIFDSEAISSGLDSDCNANGIPDGCESLRDCNRNGVYDACDIQNGDLEDRNRDGTPDDCEESSCRIPGDFNLDSSLNLTDAILELRYLFIGGGIELPCKPGEEDHFANLFLLDWQGDGVFDISDPVSLLTYLFLGTAPHIYSVAGSEQTACVEVYGCP